MVDHAYFKTVEHLVGVGKVIRQSKEIARVRYDINVLQKMIERRTTTKTDVIKGLKQIQVHIEPISDFQMPLGEIFTLIIEDGRRLSFCVTNLATGAISALSGFHQSDSG